MSLDAQWIWFNSAHGGYGVLRKRLRRSDFTNQLTVQLAAFDRYELYVDGQLKLEGPLPGDLSRWIPLDTTTFDVAVDGGAEICIDVIVYHSSCEHVHYRGESRPGFWAIFESGDQRVVTDASWQATALSAWSGDTPRMNFLLDPLESVDLRDTGWKWCGASAVDFSDDLPWQSATLVDLPLPIGNLGWQRPNLYPERNLLQPKKYSIGCVEWQPERLPMDETAKVAGNVSIQTIKTWSECTHGNEFSLNTAEANLLIVDFEDEVVGFPFLEVESSVPVTIDVGWSERLDANNNPILHSKGTSYIARFQVPDGRSTLRTFQWSGFRYLRILVRSESNEAADVTLEVSGMRRVVSPVQSLPTLDGTDAMSRIRRLCRHTLEQTLPEFPSDCPSREKAHYWSDGFLISMAWEQCYGDSRFMDWYLEAFRRVPLRADGLFSSVYPGNHKVLIDMCLIPLIGVSMLWDSRGSCPIDSVYFEKARCVLEWFGNHTGESGMVEAGAWNADADDLVFLDHPGLPWHQFDHPSLDRRDPSCALNLYYLYALQSLARMADVFQPELSKGLLEQACKLQQRVRDTFWDGRLLRDSPPHEVHDAGHSWLANSLGVLTGVILGGEARQVMQQMIDDYDVVCRCSPGTIHWFLLAMQKTELKEEVELVIVRLFEPMLESGAVTTWETFEGAIEDSLCHPWLAAPMCLFLESRLETSPSIATIEMG